MNRLKNHSKKKRRYIAYFFLLFTFFIGFYVIVNVINLKIAYLNPPYKEYKIVIPLVYPSTGVLLSVNSNETIYVEITLKYTGYLIERQPVTIEAGGTLSPELSEQISTISVGFEGALPYSEDYEVSPIGPPFASISLHPTEKSPLRSISLGAGLSGDPIKIEWPVQGDYHPTIVIFYKNFQVIQYDYEQYRLPVSSSRVMRQERYSRINNVLSMVLFMFSLIEAASIVKKYWNS